MQDSSKLVKVSGSTCEGCYALKGCYVFKVVQNAQYRRLASIKHDLWTGAMALLINSKKSKVFRWHDSGDVQDEAHLIKIFHHAGRTASGVSQLDIEYHHNQWCLDNGYPVNSYKPQAGRPKLQASSAKLKDSQASSPHRQIFAR